MPSRITLRAGLASVVLLIAACSSSSPSSGGYTGLSTGGTSAGADSASGGGGSPGAAAAGASGAPVMTAGGSAGSAGSSDVGGQSTGGSAGSSGAPSGGAAGAGSAGGPAGGTGGTGGTGGSPAATMSAGCTKPATQALGSFVKFPLTVTGQPTASLNRLYYVRLPANYDPSHAYRVVYLGPGCGQAQDTLTNRKGLPFESDPIATSAKTDAILVQLEPGQYNPAEYNPVNCRPGNTSGCTTTSAYCFDDWAYLSTIPDGVGGVVAIERAYFDLLHKTIEANYCVDPSHQFYSGYSSGGWLAQQLGCWFPDVLRAQANVTGGLPPPIKANVMGANDYCVKKPIAAFLIHNNPDPSNAFAGSVDSASRLFKLNGCTGTFNQPPLPDSTAALPAGLEAYSVTGVPNTNAFRCFKYSTCPADHPMVFCVSNDSMHNDQAARAVPAFWEFFSKF